MQHCRFEEATRQLLLAEPKNHCNWSAEDYRNAIEAYSDLILALDVQTFAILPRSASGRQLPDTWDWGDLSQTPEWKPAPIEKEPAPKNPEKVPPSPALPLPRITHDEDCQIRPEDLHFEDGKASFTKFIYPTLGDTQFEILHPAIRKEFDAIKEYFELALGSKTITCHITLEAADSVIHSKTARFLHDNLINGTLIEKIENRSIKDHILKGDDGIFSLDEKLKEVIHLDKSENDLDWLLAKLQPLKQSKHYYNLRHLSSLHDAATFRLRMTGPPVSFIFVVKGPQHYYVVWETYETKETTGAAPSATIHTTILMPLRINGKHSHFYSILAITKYLYATQESSLSIAHGT